VTANKNIEIYNHNYFSCKVTY